MKAAIIVFPGSNCDRDIAVSLEKVAKIKPVMVWHKETNLPNCDLVVVPGGFTFGDYLRCGSIAANSPIMKDIKKEAIRGMPTLGVCNGFQILAESGLLPGTLIKNNCLSFLCKTVSLKVNNCNTKFSNKYSRNEIINIPIAHNEGNFFANDDTLKEIVDGDQIVFKYCDLEGNTDQISNPNGSIYNIAGIINKEGNVLGMMPHPERATCEITKLTDGEKLFESIAESLL
ncbi:MAG: phosphoribosylformylglycinamidine synthase subunit PurQ [Pseudomonadota bacterium]|nr:phosphoribosylformylglycinamidine synthase subunit PurQ [Pseudomonadota bacterium]MEC7830962.1 phosphoribosylformylglycinamidine synthase subunit PurQ [Pseudomonadota bacterium]